MADKTRLRSRVAPSMSNTDPATTHEAASELEECLGVNFKDRQLLERAFVHRSLLNETHRPASESNERLEFLGDAVLGYIVARDLYERFPSATEGQMTTMRADLVRWETLAVVAARLGLGKYLQLGRGEEQTGGRTRPMNLARVYEAVVGAVLQDGSITEAARFVRRTMRPELKAIDTLSSESDVKSRLQEKVQSRRGSAPTYHITGVEGPDHARTYQVEVRLGDIVLGRGAGPNKRSAERLAASEALIQIETHN